MPTARPPDEADAALPRAGRQVLLRRLSPADLAVFADYRSDDELARYQGWQPMSRDAALAFLQAMQAAPFLVAGAWFQVGIAEAATGRLLGDLGVCLHADGHAEIGITLQRSAQGRGLGTEALGLLIALLFERPQVDRVVGITDVRNAASARLLARAGLQHVQTVETRFRGAPCTEWVFERRRGPAAPAAAHHA